MLALFSGAAGYCLILVSHFGIGGYWCCWVFVGGAGFCDGSDPFGGVVVVFGDMGSLGFFLGLTFCLRIFWVLLELLLCFLVRVLWSFSGGWSFVGFSTCYGGAGVLWWEVFSFLGTEQVAIDGGEGRFLCLV